MDQPTLERALYIDASPSTVFEVITSPEHLTQWWPDEAAYEPEAGSTGTITFGTCGAPDTKVVPFTVLEVDRPHRFTFRWDQTPGEPARAGNSLLVTFVLTASGDGTMLTLTESGFFDRPLTAAEADAQFLDHCNGWDHFLPRLVEYAPRVVPAR